MWKGTALNEEKRLAGSALTFGFCFLRCHVEFDFLQACRVIYTYV